MLTPTNKHIELVVRGILDDDTGLFADLTVSDPVARAQFGEKEDALVFAGVATRP